MNAFRYFGGYTKEILYDNMKQVVITRALKSTDSEWNTKFEDFFSNMDSFLAYAAHIDPKQKVRSKIQWIC